jgi:energy-coupling factor transporter ATP-binding protein EcfA2
VNVFFGDNGSGKTSLLRILNAAMDRDSVSLRHVTFSRASVTVHSISHDRDFTLTLERNASPTASEMSPRKSRLRSGLAFPIESGEVRRGGNLQASSRILSWTTDCPVKAIQEVPRWRHEWLPTTRLYGSPDEILRAHDAYEARTQTWIDDAFPRVFQQVWSGYARSVLEEIGNAQSRGLAEMFAVLLDTSPREGPIEDLALVFRRVRSFLDRQAVPIPSQPFSTIDGFRARCETDARFRALVLRLNEVEAEIEACNHPRSKLEELLGKMLGGGKRINVGEGLSVQLPSGEDLSPVLLSSGEKHLLVLLVAALSAGESLLLIDEPELSLNVDWQRALVPTLRELNASSQLIMATHSPEICAGLPEASTFRM